ncbi:TonB-dependent receptor [Galbibacter mesophilus]|uniref:TonB-dependent receptor n=1 Tax=Galbibacter mesophilus TaxID=379069 RepID=UPI00191CCBE7|nr:TonB-dependent receptor [Galbibacter mesophilus]MCM5662615.1 TonB-dependent receptor [Galbibacter mesophilus]
MKNLYIAIILAMVAQFSYSQTIYKGRITDAEKNPLTGVNVISKANPSNGVSTNIHGDFSITLDSPEVLLTYIGFNTKEVVLKTNFNLIPLQESTQALEEIVVSASREEQKRSEIPGAISVISAQTIEKTKAFGIEQLVNQAPGVYMSTSKASGNEQHMMAVRSPISTKSLFLYLEDGLPIRPTAVFNHNALLEMNDVSFGRMEILKGPASSIYGSEAIGGSFNFITKQPSRDFSGYLGFQANDMGLTRYDFEASTYANEKFGVYLGTHYVQRNNGPIQHSDYEKFAVTFKTVYHIDPSLTWTNVFDMIDYRSDMTGSLTQDDYEAGNYESDQTFTEREAQAFRFRSTLDKQWNNQNKTSFNFVFRNNVMDQIPSYRIRQFRQNGQLTGFGKGETTSNSYNSFVGLIQHKKDFNFANSSLIVGGTVDYSPQTYFERPMDVFVDPNTGINTGYEIKDEYAVNYDADILNYAGFLQYEINPFEDFKVTAALRYDKFEYDYNNYLASGEEPKYSARDYDNIAPKIGFNYNLSNKSGVYANYSNGFTPPQVSTIYSNTHAATDGTTGELKPSSYDNYEVGGYFVSEKWKLDLALYVLDGKNTLITLRDSNDRFYIANAGKTRSYGVEYGITYRPTPELSFAHNGSFARHRYITFFQSGVDYSHTDQEVAPSLLGNTQINYAPRFIKNFSIGLEYELVGSYNTSLENQIDNGDGTFSTSTYDGHNIFNIRASYQMANFEIWGHALNIFDTLYATRASYNIYSRQNTYSVGNPLAFHAGIRYKF